MLRLPKGIVVTASAEMPSPDPSSGDQAPWMLDSVQGLRYPLRPPGVTESLVSLSDLDHLESLFDSASEISLSPSFALSGFGLRS